MAGTITFVAAGAIAVNNTVTTQAVVAPACQADDILIAALINKSGTANTISAPDGTWTKIIEGRNVCTGSIDRHGFAVFWKRATASNGTYTFSKATDDNLTFGGAIVAYRGCMLNSSPLDASGSAFATTAGSADNVTFPAFDPTATNNETVFVAFYGNDLTTFGTAMSSDTNPDCTKRLDVESSTGNDCSIAICSGSNNGGSIAARTWASSATTDAGSSGVVFALVPQEIASATFSVTLATITLAATSTIANSIYTATLAATLEDAAITTDSDLLIQGTLAATLETIALAATSTIADASANATLAATLGDMTTAIAADLIAGGSLAGTLGSITPAIAAELDIEATLSNVLGAVTLASSADLIASGALNLTLGLTTLTSDADLTAKATLSGTLGDISISSTADLVASATLSGTLGDLALAATSTFGNVESNGALAVSLDPLGFAASSELLVSASFSGQLAAITLTSASTVANNVYSAAFDGTLDDMTLIGAGGLRIAAQSDVTLGILLAVIRTKKYTPRAGVTASVLAVDGKPPILAKRITAAQVSGRQVFIVQENETHVTDI